MYHYDRMQKTKKIGDQLADEIIKKLSNMKERDLQTRINLVLQLANLMKIMDDFEGEGWTGKIEEES